MHVHLHVAQLQDEWTREDGESLQDQDVNHVLHRLSIRQLERHLSPQQVLNVSAHSIHVQSRNELPVLVVQKIDILLAWFR